MTMRSIIAEDVQFALPIPPLGAHPRLDRVAAATFEQLSAALVFLSVFEPDAFLSWLNLVRKSVGGVDGVEGLAEVVWEGVGGGDRVPAGLDLDLAVAAGGLHEFPDRPAGLGLD